MQTRLFIIGTTEIPQEFKDPIQYNSQLFESPYELGPVLRHLIGEKIIICYLSYLENRHFDIYALLQKEVPHLKCFFIVDELSPSMQNKIKQQEELIVLWRSEAPDIPVYIENYLAGKKIKLRQDARSQHKKNGLLRPSLISKNMANQSFRPMIGGSIENISSNGSCVKIKSRFYEKKDFITLTYQSKDGEYRTLEGQIKWTKWCAIEQAQQVGIQLLAQN